MEELQPLTLNKQEMSNMHTSEELKNFILNGISYDTGKVNYNYLKQVKQDFPGANDEVLSDTIRAYEKAGFISKCNNLKGIFPIHLVAKQDGGFRLVHNLQRLNKLFVAPKVKLSTPFSALRKEVSYVAKLDLTNAYFHFKLQEDFSRFFGFRHQGVHYKFDVLPFGWSMSPYLAIRLLKPIEQKLQKQFPQGTVSLYFDDTFLGGTTFEETQQMIDSAVRLFEELGISLNMSKSTITPVSSVDWLGFRFESNALFQTKDNLRKLQKLSETRKELQTVGATMSLIGLLNFMARVCPQVRPTCSYLSQIIPQKLRADKSKHEEKWRSNEATEKLIEQAVQTIQLDQPFRVQYHDRSFQVFVDASEKFAGLASREETKSVEFPPEYQNSNILVKESFAIYQAVCLAPEKSNLKIFSDSRAAFWTFKKGICENLQVLELVQSTFSVACRRQINFIIQWIPTEHNLADKPSRVFHQYKGNMIFKQLYYNIPLKMIIDFLDYTTVKKQSNAQAFSMIRQYLKSRKRGAYFTKYHRDDIRPILKQSKAQEKRDILKSIATHELMYVPKKKSNAIMKQLDSNQQRIVFIASKIHNDKARETFVDQNYLVEEAKEEVKAQIIEPIYVENVYIQNEEVEERQIISSLTQNLKQIQEEKQDSTVDTKDSREQSVSSKFDRKWVPLDISDLKEKGGKWPDLIENKMIVQRKSKRIEKLKQLREQSVQKTS